MSYSATVTMAGTVSYGMAVASGGDDGSPPNRRANFNFTSGCQSVGGPTFLRGQEGGSLEERIESFLKGGAGDQASPGSPPRDLVYGTPKKCPNPPERRKKDQHRFTPLQRRGPNSNRRTIRPPQLEQGNAGSPTLDAWERFLISRLASRTQGRFPNNKD